VKKKGALPRAYIRIDPAIIDRHPDPGAMLTVLCLAERQHPRGRFRGTDILDARLGRATVRKLLKRGDLIEQGGLVYVEGWDEWQEGDWKVGERMSRVRSRRHTTVTNTRPGDDEGGQGGAPATVTSPSPKRHPPSEASGVRQETELLSEFLSPPSGGGVPVGDRSIDLGPSTPPHAAGRTPEAITPATLPPHDPANGLERQVAERVSDLAAKVAALEDRPATEADVVDVLTSVSATSKGRSLRTIRGAPPDWLGATLAACDAFERDLVLDNMPAPTGEEE
jgi:hypothetical protein